MNAQVLRFIAIAAALLLPATRSVADFQAPTPFQEELLSAADWGRCIFEKIPKNWDSTCFDLQQIAQNVSPDGVADAHRRWGLCLPETIDESKPLIILIHGLDEDASDCRCMQSLLNADGWQTAIFCYPSERPIPANAQLFQQHFEALRETFPNLRISVVTQSLGALVARKYIEGSDYHGGIDRLIMIAPPNAGSKWAKYSLVEKLQTNWYRWRHDPGWNAVWMIEEGICQSGFELKPNSKFLRDLNSRSPNASVKYTIVAGDLPVGDRIVADAISIPANYLSEHFGQYPGAEPAAVAMRVFANNLRIKSGSSDGPVALCSAKMPGVSDVVVLHADHTSLYEPIDGRPPAAWPIVRNRLKEQYAR
jgi:triacylglycerol esterase/lipase EstA (alpha/beta hydrolase family)